MRATIILLTAALVASGAAVVITLEGDPPVFRVENSAILLKLNNPNFEAIFRVTVDKPDAPPIAGAYSMVEGALVFRPKYRLEPGLAYHATFRLVNETASGAFTAPKPKVEPTSYVERIYPSSSALPENQLKFYIHFSASMSRGEASKRIHLIEDGANEVKHPFLELDEELWDRDFRRFTLLFDPGRVKRDILPNREVGPPLKAGHSYTLVVDSDWKDATNVQLKEPFKKAFQAGPAERAPIDPKQWQILAPVPGTTGPLVVDFPRPLDAALLLRFLDVSDAKGNLIQGKVTLDNEERRWLFTPSTPWVASRYSIEVVSTLEDMAGNKIGRAFDVDRFEQVEQRVTSGTYSLPFTVGDSGGSERPTTRRK